MLQHNIFIGMAYFRSGIYNPITGWQLAVASYDQFREIVVICISSCFFVPLIFIHTYSVETLTGIKFIIWK
jgi:hypothetical protein